MADDNGFPGTSQRGEIRLTDKKRFQMGLDGSVESLLTTSAVYGRGFASNSEAWKALAPDRGPSSLEINGIYQLPISDRAVRMIMEWEADNYKIHPEWPNSKDSGVTIGYGYDLGQVSKKQFLHDWGERLDADEIETLGKVIGLRGVRARDAVSKVRFIRIPQEMARKVLLEKTLPRFVQKTVEAYPGSQYLSPDSFGALVSMTFNRGEDVPDLPKGKKESLEAPADRYAEKRMIKTAIENGDQHDIPFLIRHSKRLWENQGLDGLVRRREEEAKLFAEGLKGESKWTAWDAMRKLETTRPSSRLYPLSFFSRNPQN